MVHVVHALIAAKGAEAREKKFGMCKRPVRPHQITTGQQPGCGVSGGPGFYGDSGTSATTKASGAIGCTGEAARSGRRFASAQVGNLARRGWLLLLDRADTAPGARLQTSKLTTESERRAEAFMASSARA